MKARDELTGNELFAQANHCLKSKFSESLRVFLKPFESLCKGWRNACLAKARHALKACEVVDGHDAREDGRRDAHLTQATHPILEDLVVVEELTCRATWA